MVWLFFVWIIIQTGVVFPANPGDIVITEFFFNPSEVGVLPEYVELFNSTDSDIDLNGWKVDIDGIQVEIDDSCNLELSYTDETACTNAGGVWDPFSINSNDYAVILSSSGLLRSEDSTTYCSSFHYGFPLNECVVPVDNLFWRIGTFSELSNDSGRIKIWDDSDTLNVIDSVTYNMMVGLDFPVGDDVVGRAAVFIIDPISEYADSLNDDGLNWRSSEHPSEEYLSNGSSSDFGSPMSSNFITPKISIKAYETPNTDSTKNTFKIDSDSTIFRPGSDGRPGGYAAMQLVGLAIDFNGDDVTLDSLDWDDSLDGAINNNISLIDSSKTDSIWGHPVSLRQDTNLTLNIYTIPLIARSEGFWGKTETIIYIEQEINTPPKIQKINNQTSQFIINMFDNQYDSLFAVVTDSLLCEASCTREDSNFYFPNAYFGYPNSSSGSYENYENNSPFLWSSDYDSLLSTTDSLVTYFIAPNIEPMTNISANNIRDTLKFKLQATDPFGESDSQIVTIIVHNKNQKPVIGLDSTNISEIDLIAGYSNKFIVNGSQIELYEFDASGVYMNTTIIGQITDVDNDLNFTIIPLGTNCHSGFENNYCVSGTTIKTDHKVSYDDLVIPFTVDDGVQTPIDGWNSESTSDTSYLEIQYIQRVTNAVTFDNPIIAINEYFHLPEDSTLTTDTTEIGFNIDFILDTIPTYNVNWDSLNWSFDKLDSELEQRVFAYKSGNTFKIDSLSNNFNGQTGLKVSVADFDNAVNSLVDSIIINIPIYIDQRNDTLKHFNLYHDIKSYSINVSTIESIRGVRYFRLAQFSSNNNTSNPTPKKLRFEWERNDYLDIDTNTDLNKDTELNIFYRLELIDTLTNVVSILKDSLQHNNFLEFENIWAEIDSLGDEFPFYYDSLGYGPQLEYDTIDINGLSTYRWRVVATNYWQDDLDEDPPVGISQEWNMTDFKIDLLQPEVTNLYIMLNEMYTGFYDLLWNSSEAFLTDYTFLSIKEEAFQFPKISMLNPRRITDNLFHFTGIIPTDLESAIITFDLDIRDNAMNSGVRQDTVSYIKYNPDTGSRLISPSNNVTIFLQKNSVSEPVHIFITEENSNITSRESNTELYQLTPTIHFYPNELILNKPGSIYFDISDYLSSEYEPWQLTIFEINDTESISLTTNISEGMLTASIDKLGDYAVFVNTAIEKPLPTKFELKRNFPNPFNPSTTIPIELSEESYVEVVVYNILGENIVVLSKGVKSPGYHNIFWNGKNQFGKPVSSGIYFVSVHFGQKFYHQKMMLLK